MISKLNTGGIKLSFAAYLHHDLDLAPISSSAPPAYSTLVVDPVSGVYIGEDLEDPHPGADDLNIRIEQFNSVTEDEKMNKSIDRSPSQALNNFKKKLLTIKSWPNLIRNPRKH